MSEPVRTTQVITETRELTVSTVRIAHRDYDTVVFDDSDDKRHSGKAVGGYVIDQSSKRRATREQAMDDHRDAVRAARFEEIR